MPGTDGKDPHNRSVKPDDDDEDLVDKMLKKAGCADQHYAIQLCMVEKQDWRKCQTEVKGT